MQKQSRRSTAQLISAFVFALQLLQYLLNFKPLATLMAVRPGLCVTWSETPKTGFLTILIKSTTATNTPHFNMIKKGKMMNCFNKFNGHIFGNKKAYMCHKIVLFHTQFGGMIMLSCDRIIRLGYNITHSFFFVFVSEFDLTHFFIFVFMSSFPNLMSVQMSQLSRLREMMIQLKK